jgi:hypothetical protein
MLVRVLLMALMVLSSSLSGTARADVILTLQIDPARSFVDAFYHPAPAFVFIPPILFCVIGEPCPPAIEPPPPDLPAHYFYPVDGWLQLTLRPPSAWDGTNAFVEPLSLHTDSPYQPFEFLRAPGRIADDGSAHFETGGCSPLPGICAIVGGIIFGKADGSFDRTTLFLTGDETRSSLNSGPYTDYRYTIYATVGDLSAAAVPEPGTFLLAMAGLLLLWTSARQPHASSGSKVKV